MEETRGLKALESWAKRVTVGYSGVNVRDMSSSFRDGLAFCAIVHHYRPDLINFESLSKENILHNNSLAFSTAEKQLGVPALLDAEDMVKFARPDRLSIITYLSQLFNCFENQNRVTKIRLATKRVFKEGQIGPPSKVPLSEQKNSIAMISKDVCQTCKHRVFILERLIVVGKLYHRTCFKCCKCNSLLKPGAYVESDSAGLYECAICPRDEEKAQVHTVSVESLKPELKTYSSPEPSIEVLTAMSPLASPKLSLLSSSLSIARNSFLKKALPMETNQESVNTVSPDTEEVASCDNSSMDDSIVSDDAEKCTVISVENKIEAVESKESIPQNNTAPEMETSVKVPEIKLSQMPESTFSSKPEEQSSSSSQKHYQSLFTREIKSLKPLSIPTIYGTENQDHSHSSLPHNAGSKSADFIKTTNFSIPFIKSSTYTSPLPLPRPSSVTNFQSKELPSTSLSLRQEKGNSDSTINETVDEKWSKTYRRGSLGSENKISNLSHSNFKRSESEMYSSKLHKDIVPNVLTTNQPVLEFQKNSPNRDETVNVSNSADMCVETTVNSNTTPLTTSKELPIDRVTDTNAVERPKSLVRQLIELREANIAVNSISNSNIGKIQHRKMSLDIEANHKSKTSTVAKEADSKKTISPFFQNSDLEKSIGDINVEQQRSKSVCDSTDSQISNKFSNDAIINSTELAKSVDTDQNEVLNELSKSSLCDATVISSLEKTPSFTETDNLKNDFYRESAVEIKVTTTSIEQKEDVELYPDDLNPFGDDDETNIESVKSVQQYPDTLNPFGDSDEDNDIDVGKNVAEDYDETKNPFASDEAEEEDYKQYQLVTPTKVPKPPVPAVRTSIIDKSPLFKQSQLSIDLTVSPTGSMKGTLKKRKAPKPPQLSDVFQNDSFGASSEGSSPSLHATPSPNKYLSRTPSPKILKNKPAPPPPLFTPKHENLNSSLQDQVANGKQLKEMDNMKLKSSDTPLSSPSKTNKGTLQRSDSKQSNNQWKNKKRPAPPVPIPPRREIKKIPLKEIQSEMSEIEEKQIDLEKQGRELEVLIRERDKDEEPTVEEEECIMQLFELVNQKNALFRRQAELMYIKRSQRLEEEQVELEFQIRCIMLKPASQKNDEDKNREELLMQRLLDVVDQRNEIVDSIEMDRRREAEEDVSVQEQMEIKNSDLPITAEIKEKSANKKKKSKHKEKKDKKKHHDESKSGSEDSSKKDTLHRKKKWF